MCAQSGVIAAEATTESGIRLTVAPGVRPGHRSSIHEHINRIHPYRKGAHVNSYAVVQRDTLS